MYVDKIDKVTFNKSIINVLSNYLTSSPPPDEKSVAFLTIP